MDELVKWKENPGKKPLLLRGVRQCGKTYLLKEFGAAQYEDVFYCKFDEDSRLAGFFETDLNPHRIIKDLSVFRGRDILQGRTLVIFDEVQSCGKALTSLKYFCEEAPGYHIIAAGSLLGVAVPKGTSFPVGKVEFMDLFPMSFYEFLAAHNEMLAAYARENPPDAMDPFRDRLKELYRDYLIVGGMPEAVQSWVDRQSINDVEKIQSQIIQSYENDFAKHAPLSYFPKLSAVWHSIPAQLAKENRKFIFSQVKKGWRAKDLEDALEWLLRAGIVYKATNIEKPHVPLGAYANHTFFKLYLCDVGLLRRMANVPPGVMLEETGLFTEFRGAMAENAVCCELKRIYGKEIYYWTADGSGRAEVDFIVQDGAYIIPIEVKAQRASHAKSLAEYCKKYQPQKAFVVSMEAKPGTVPAYMAWRFREYVNG
jgi:predicted AAA+ superfamily ATPase